METDFNKALISGNMRAVRKLLAEGKTWVGSKLDFDYNIISHPKNSKDFADHIKLILDLKLCDKNYVEDDYSRPCFEWFFVLTKRYLERLRKVKSNKITDIKCGYILASYEEALRITEQMSADKENYMMPSIIVSKKRGTEFAYKIKVEAYIDTLVSEANSLTFNGEELINILAKLSGANVTTC